MFRTMTLAGAAAALAMSATAAQAQTGPMPAPEFVKMAGASDKFEITEAQIAETHSHNPAILRFARKMIHDHTQSTMEVKAAATRMMGHAPPPPMLRPDQERMVADLRAQRGPDFDRTYLHQQMASHQEALQLMQNYAANGDAPPLKRVASQVAPVVQSHIDMLRSMHAM